LTFWFRSSRKKQSFLLFFHLFFTLFVFSQQKITGVVSGENNVPLVGATVLLRNSNVSIVTGNDGSFSINAKPGDVLEISFVGYKSHEVKINSETTLTIALQTEALSLNDIVVTGYTSQKIKEITGSVAVVKPKDLVAVPAGQVEQMLQGRVAGLNVITSGMPGGPTNVRLHGIGNFGDVTPLYIIDGVQGNINNLNPNDIETLQVLKDAGAYSIYGVRGANGVIVVTTRNGKYGKTKVSYDFYVGVTTPLKSPEVLNPQEMADLTWLAKRNSGDTMSNGNPDDFFYGNDDTPVLPDYFIDASIFTGYFQGDPMVDPASYNIDFTAGRPIKQIQPTNKSGTNWFDEIFSPALSQNHTLTVSGGNEKNKYLFSFGYLDQEGTLLNTHLKRYTFRVNNLFTVNNKIRIGENLQLSYRDNPKISMEQGLYNNDWNNDILNALASQPILPVYDIRTGWAHFFPHFFASNPVAQRVLAKDNKSHFWEVFGNVYGETDFLRYFTFRTSFGGSFTSKYSINYGISSYYPTGDSLPNNFLTESSGYSRSWTWTNMVSYAKSINIDHSLKAMAGIEAIDNYSRENTGMSAGFFSDDVNYRFLTNGSPGTQNNFSFATASTLYSLIGNVEYGFKEKYFLRATVRRDGSSLFGSQNRYGWFPSFSAAWRITEENFMRSSQWVTEFKLRGSWGKTGFYGNTDPNNQYTLYGGSISDVYYDIYGTNNPVRGFRAMRLGDPRTGWQQDIVANIGFESVLWRGKLSITADWYNKKTEGLLFPVRLPDVLGGADPPNVNVGRIKNTGIDLLIGSKGKFSKSWNWDASIVFTKYNNKIVQLNELPFFSPVFQSNVGPIVRNEVGYPVGSFYGYKIIGIFSDAAEVSKAPVQNAAAPGRFRYLNADGNDTINAADRIHFGNPNPNFTVGINIGINYQNFDFSTFFYASVGNDVMNLGRRLTDFYSTIDGAPGGIVSAKSKAALYDSWTPRHTNTSVPVAENNFNFSNANAENSYTLEDGSYFRNKSIILGYTFPAAMMKKMKIEKIRIYLQAVNLFTITNYSGLDPELSGRSDSFGIDFGYYPNNQKQYFFGASINF